ncbi:hypothetical protein P8629_07685 [Hydrogenovibrio sp. 3SP14C1]|uniref:hypothetical protein n=1 Tax=Hydrogenovibrio sp. 3SP14C1 TaxID=3038774 RepID=UPI002416C8DA|nr:hypothetical protein [Hydrogenovibrio sp. 3SP14C1]MDG4812886.1 hypothetical protein [Hydrogenovibrio sp. 3SP14C1]
MNIYSHEIASYKREIDAFTTEYEMGSKEGNLTHYSLALSNRTNLLVIGLCSLVEAYLYEVAHKAEIDTPFKIDDLKGNGISRLKTFITRSKGIDFGEITTWEEFHQIYQLRNALVHGYGGLVDSVDIGKVEKALKTLKCSDALVGGRRIRLMPGSLSKFCNIVENTITQVEART